MARYSDTAVYANNSVIDINLVGEGFEGAQITDGGALECHTDDTTCCREIDNPNGTGRGEWYYPDGTVVPPPGNSENRFYRTRDHMVIRLNRIDGDRGAFKLTGVYRCEIHGIGEVNVTRYVLIVAECKQKYINFILKSIIILIMYLTYMYMKPNVVTWKNSQMEL